MNKSFNGVSLPVGLTEEVLVLMARGLKGEIPGRDREWYLCNAYAEFSNKAYYLSWRDAKEDMTRFLHALGIDTSGEGFEDEDEEGWAIILPDYICGENARERRLSLLGSILRECFHD